jgi:hypothetical protein
MDSRMLVGAPDETSCGAHSWLSVPQLLIQGDDIS